MLPTRKPQSSVDQVRRRRGRRLPPGKRGDEASGEHELLAPRLLRSQTLSALHEAVQRSEITADVAREHLARIGRMPIRLLGGAVLRRRAWELADRLGWASTYDAEYVALTQLEPDALMTLDAELAPSVEGIVATASIDALDAKPLLDRPKRLRVAAAPPSRARRAPLRADAGPWNGSRLRHSGDTTSR